MVYHVGLVKGSGRCKCWNNQHKRDTVVVELRRSIDFLSCELWQYLGERETTKEGYRANKRGLLEFINSRYNTNFRRIIID